MGKSWRHLQASGEEQRSASRGAEGRWATLRWTSLVFCGTHREQRWEGNELLLPALNVGGREKDVGVGTMMPTSPSRGQPRMCTAPPFTQCEDNRSGPPEQRTPAPVWRSQTTRARRARRVVGGLSIYAQMTSLYSLPSFNHSHRAHVCAHTCMYDYVSG